MEGFGARDGKEVSDLDSFALVFAELTEIFPPRCGHRQVEVDGGEGPSSLVASVAAVSAIVSPGMGMAVVLRYKRKHHVWKRGAKGRLEKVF